MGYKIFNNEFIKNFNKSQKKTPYYIYDTQLLEETFEQATRCLEKNIKNAQIHYAIKANTHPKIIDIARKYKIGIDCVSGGEITQALQNNIKPKEIVFAGVGKSDDEILLALKNDIYCFNCESIQEIEVINKLASDAGKIAKICIRINPNIDAKTHHYISTGQFDDKFGISFKDTIIFLNEKINQLSNIEFIGLHYHVGSQILDKNVFKELAQTVNDHVLTMQARNIRITDINFGGGLGIDYANPKENPIVDFEEYFKTFAENFCHENMRIHFELGRALVAQSGAIVSKVLFNKKTYTTNFLIIDAGMTELIRPALYQSKHHIESLSNKSNVEKYHIVGPICESSDIMAKNIELPLSSRGDIIVIYSTGAYAKVLASQYNLRPLIEEYFI